MNEPSSFTKLSVAPIAQPISETVLSPTKHKPALFSPESPANDAEEDDSTIKCICGFKHDDGSSVFCEKCETWQHTECYYYDVKNDRVPTKDELDKISHFCTDCRPRALDVHAAISRQKSRIGGFDTDDKKSKKPASKSHKKKTRPEVNGALTNGWPSDGDGAHDRTSRSPRESVPAGKRPKNHHRSSQSMGLSSTTQTLTSHPHKRSASSLQSPTKVATKQTPSQALKENYSESFLHLYDNDLPDHNPRANHFSSISITQDLSNWAVDVDALKEATRGFAHAEVFHRIEQPLENIMGNPPLKQTREDLRVSIDGRHPRWIYLASEGYTKRNTIVDELKGSIGHMKEYISDPHNRWDYLRHPAPFVFFHPKLPIYIDTRNVGSASRYLRRSCRPNLSMTTFLENDSEYHFCFTAKEDIEPGVEFTIGWTLDEHMRKFSSNKNDMAQDLSPDGEEYFTDWVGKVSPEFGGCACGLPESCWFVRYDPEFRQSSKSKGARVHRRTQRNSHDSSEADDGGTTSPSNSGSRALTPTGLANSNALGLDISERDKRKIAMLERTLENDKHQPATKKKKRNSGGTTAIPSGTSVAVRSSGIISDQNSINMEQPKAPAPAAASVSLPNTPGYPSRAQYADASTSARKSGSPSNKAVNGIGRVRNNASAKQRWSHPNTPTMPSPLRSNYVSTGVQADLGQEGDWLQPAEAKKSSKKPYLSLTKRLLLRSQRDRQMRDERRRSGDAENHRQSPGLENGHLEGTQIEAVDVEMVDSPKAANSGLPRTGAEPSVEEARPPPWPSGEMVMDVNGDQQATLHVQPVQKQPELPERASSSPVSQAPAPTTIQQLTATTQSTSSTQHLPTPSSSVNVQPSPVKKKVSLSDYIKRKGSHTSDSKASNVASPEMTHAPPKSSTLQATVEEPSSLDNAVTDTPKKEEEDPLESVHTAEEGKAPS